MDGAKTEVKAFTIVAKNSGTHPSLHASLITLLKTLVFLLDPLCMTLY